MEIDEFPRGTRVLVKFARNVDAIGEVVHCNTIRIVGRDPIPYVSVSINGVIRAVDPNNLTRTE